MYRSITLFGLLVSTPAFAQDTHSGPDHNQIDGTRFDIHANLNQYSMLGFGARFEFAVVPDGFIRGNVRDELAVAFGADLFFGPTWHSDSGDYYGGSYFIPVGVAQWNFYLGERWSVFPELGVAVHVGLDRDGWTGRNGREYGWVYPALATGVGARYHFNGNVTLLGRISSPGGLQIGVVF